MTGRGNISQVSAIRRATRSAGSLAVHSPDQVAVTHAVTGGRGRPRGAHPVSGANVVTTDNSDWATNCPEYKVTAVQVDLIPETVADGAAQEPVIAGSNR